MRPTSSIMFAKGMMIFTAFVVCTLVVGSLLEPLLPPTPPPPPPAQSAAAPITPPSLKTPVEQGLEDAGACLVIRGDIGRPGWWYGVGRPTSACITGSLYTRTDIAGLFVCGSMGWIDVIDEREER